MILLALILILLAAGILAWLSELYNSRYPKWVALGGVFAACFPLDYRPRDSCDVRDMHPIGLMDSIGIMRIITTPRGTGAALGPSARRCGHV